MKQIFEIKDEKIIEELLDSVEYGTLAICADNKPYSLPLNFVKIGDALYFHGAKKGKKVDIFKQNTQASFSVVKPYAMIQSYFSSNEELACPATQFFKSVIVDGTIVFVEKYDEKVQALSALMQKLQPEGGYKPLSDEAYVKSINATLVYKLNVEKLRAKFKFGQHLSQERFEIIIEHLSAREDAVDSVTIEAMKEFKNGV
jgi:nitroimidazol reductase NimA-like FMN-containing flavoprotein (pyridoxamine 5'-phosphate oxidase superfamily)